MTLPPIAPRGGCLEVDTLLGLAAGQLEEAQRSDAEAHIDGCPECQLLLVEAALATDSAWLDPSSRQPTVFSVGTEVATRYRIERFVARGGMGEIYEARDLVLDENLALKTITATAADSTKAIQRLKAEVKLSRRVGNPHTCRIYDFGEHDIDGRSAIHFLTMEFIDGQALGARLREAGRLPLELVPELGRQLLEGLGAAHAAGVLHRDFKSDNVMLRSHPARGLALDAVITDFGLARALHEHAERVTSHTQALLGSAAYMAPEQVEGSTLSEATDIYAFGVVLFEVLTGTLPFRGGSPMATALLRLRRPPPKPSSVVPTLAPAWDDLVLGCLARDPAERIDCGDALLHLAELQKANSSSRLRRQRRAARTPLLFGLCAAPLSFAAAWYSKPAPPRVVEQAEQSLREDSREPAPEAPQPLDSNAPEAVARQQPSLLDVAAINAERWRLVADPLSCREATRLYREQLADAAPGSDEHQLALRQLSAIGDCVRESTSTKARVKAKPPSSEAAPEPAQPPKSPLPSDDPLGGLVDIGAARSELPAERSVSAAGASAE